VDLVVDASVVVKWFLTGEEDTNQAFLVRDDFVAGDVVLHAPAELPYEVLNALRYSALCPEERCLQAQVVLEGYGLTYHPLEGGVARRAIHIAYGDDLSVYDASYLALARELGIPLITADRQLARAASDVARPLDEYESSADR